MYSNGNLKEKVETENIDILRPLSKTNSKFNSELTTYNVVFKNIPSQFVDSIVFMKDMMMKIVENLLKYTSRKDKIKINIDHPVLTEPIELPFVFFGRLNTKYF